MNSLPEGVRHMPMCLSLDEQRGLLESVRNVVKAAPLYTPTMPRTGKPMSVRMTNCGALGWVTDKEKGYRYQATHPATGKKWPAIPEQLSALWAQYSGYRAAAEACLINFYEAPAKMGLHQDRDEEIFDAPVLSISLGDSCLFRIGTEKRNGRTVSVKLDSGDLLLLSGKARLAYHGVDKLYPDSSALLKNGGRINLTLRRVTSPDN